MKPFRKCAARRKGGYSTFNGWVKEEETEQEGRVSSEESQEYPNVKT